MKTGILLFILLICVGCQEKFIVEGDYKLYKRAGIFENKERVLRDIPLPQDSYMKGNSISVGTEYFRYGEFNFSGQLSVEDIFLYYKEQMPSFQWKEVSADIFETHTSLKYEKGEDLATILCRESDKDTEIKIIVEQKTE